MKQNAVVIKSNAYGLLISLDPDLPFEDLLREVEEKFRQTGRFFRNADLALNFRGRELTEEEENQLVWTISANSGIRVICIIDEDKERGEYFRREVLEGPSTDELHSAQIHYGTLTAGEAFETQKSAVILGDVNPGASVTAGGSVIVLGCCMGSITAGVRGGRSCFAAGLIMRPSQIRIADRTARTAITKRQDTGEYANDPKIISVRDDHIVTETLKGKWFRDLAARMAAYEDGEDVVE